MDLEGEFGGKKGQLKVAEFLLRHGIRVSADGGLFAGGVELAYAKVGAVVGVDRRVVVGAVEEILKKPLLVDIFTRISTTPLLRDAAGALGYGALEIVPKDASASGIIAGVTRIVADAGISVRQVIADDPMFTDARLLIVTSKPVPRDLIDVVLKVEGVKEVVVLA
ncbi:Uncharacterised protein [uncultured archaeon]|nr:Uncharacterised protein [uncultured archaeon]